jgi:pantoate--beta-alanine ligase
MDMEVHDTIAGFRAALDTSRSSGLRVGLVPTMGALHAGHGSLIEHAARDNDAVAVTIFVNPLQFGVNEDLASYPRDFLADLRTASEAGATHAFHPVVAEMYPEPVKTSVIVSDVAESLEATSRPAHFAGVATVVAKLFAIAGPCRAYFGEKDYQQLAVVRRMTADLSFPVEVVGCPTIRETDGLAISSRNVYLSAEQRAAAPVLYRALRAGVAAVMEGERRAAVVRRAVTKVIRSEPLADLDYAEVVDASTLERLDPLVSSVRLLVAAQFGRTRLIDNVGVLAG